MENENKQIIKIRDFETEKLRVVIYGKVDFTLKNCIISDVTFNIDTFILSRNYKYGINNCHSNSRKLPNIENKFNEVLEIDSLLNELIELEYSSWMNPLNLKWDED